MLKEKGSEFFFFEVQVAAKTVGDVVLVPCQVQACLCGFGAHRDFRQCAGDCEYYWPVPLIPIGVAKPADSTSVVGFEEHDVPR